VLAGGVVLAGAVTAGGVVLAGAVTAGGVVLAGAVTAGGVVLALGEVTADAVPDGAGVWEEVPEQADKTPTARRLQQPTRLDFTRMTRILLRGRR